MGNGLYLSLDSFISHHFVELPHRQLLHQVPSLNKSPRVEICTKLPPSTLQDAWFWDPVDYRRLSRRGSGLNALDVLDALVFPVRMASFLREAAEWPMAHHLRHMQRGDGDHVLSRYTCLVSTYPGL